MEYTRQVIIQKCKEKFQCANTFYQADIVNYRGKTRDTDELYNEIVAEFICNNIDEYKASIPKIARQTSYKTEGHDGKYSEESNREEEKIAMQLFNQSNELGGFDHIGRIIDYQTPLKSKKTDIAGKIDLLSYDGNTIRVLELKKPDSKETMLRCVLEGYTYMKTADWPKLLADFEINYDTDIKASPFVFSSGEQKKDMKEDRPYLHKLMELLDSTPYYITKKDNKYYIKES